MNPITFDSTNKPSFEVSAEAATLIKAIGAMAVGDVATHDELTTMINGSDHRPVMTTVRKHLRTEYGKVLGAIHGKGYKVLSATEILDKGHDFRARFRKANNRRVSELKTIDPATFEDQGEKSRYYQEVAHTALIHAVHEKGQQKRMTEVAASSKPAPGSTLTLTQLQQYFSPPVRATA